MRFPPSFGLLICLLLSSCAAMTQQSSPPLPEWSTVGEHWDITGLTVSTYDSIPYNTMEFETVEDPGLGGEVHNELDMAEEAAYRRARKLVVEELVQLWLDYANVYNVQPDNEGEARQAIEKHLRGIFVNRRFFDGQRNIFHIQVYVTARRVVAIIEKAFNTQVILSNNGQLEPDTSADS